MTTKLKMNRDKNNNYTYGDYLAYKYEYAKGSFYWVVYYKELKLAALVTLTEAREYIADRILEAQEYLMEND